MQLHGVMTRELRNNVIRHGNQSAGRVPVSRKYVIRLTKYIEQIVKLVKGYFIFGLDFKTMPLHYILFEGVLQSCKLKTLLRL